MSYSVNVKKHNVIDSFLKLHDGYVYTLNKKYL